MSNLSNGGNTYTNIVICIDIKILKQYSTEQKQAKRRYAINQFKSRNLADRFFIMVDFFLSGKAQLRSIEKISTNYVIQKYEELTAHNRKIRLDQFFSAISGDWENIVKGKVLFVPHRFELWPMPASPKYLAKRLPLTENWVGKVLIENGKELKDPNMVKIRKAILDCKNKHRRRTF